MILRIAEVTVHARDLSERVAGDWMRFGDTLAIVGPEEDSARVARAVRGRETALYRGVGPDELSVVYQKGRLFQKEHPDVPVLVDKGRFLLVRLPARRAREFTERGDPCFAVRPWQSGAEVFAATRRLSRRDGIPAWITELVARTNMTIFRPAAEYLVGLDTRHSLRTEYQQAADWAKRQLEQVGYDVALQSIDVAGGVSSNVVAERKGTNPNSGVVYVVAHLDSVNSLGGRDASAPGADDNASGSAGALAIAHVLASHRFRRDLRIVLFGGEEQGLFGSTQHVAALSDAERDRIVAVLNMDMIGTLNTPQPTVLLEGAEISKAMLDELATSAANHTTMQVQTSLNPFASDHVPFLSAGIPAVLTIEGADSANQFIHTAADTIDKINYDLALEILRMNVGFLADKLGNATAEDRNGPPTLREPGQVSGRFHFAGSVDAGDQRHASINLGGSVQDQLDARRQRWAENPVYGLDEPLFTADFSERVSARQSLELTLHIDLDGTDPLGVVSGTVQQGVLPPDQVAVHFVGRVTSDSTSGSARNLVVTDFRFDWPDGIHAIDRADIELFSTSPPQAIITFTDTSRGTEFGPYQTTRTSPFFREVEFDYDREEGAIDVRSYDTHTHPDRPADLPRETITLESTFARAGIRVSLAAGSGTIVDTSEAGANARWNSKELHDSMSAHWDSFANQPQWKMWIFSAKLADDDNLGGVMFDGNIDEPGGVDRQGTALFTECPFFHTEQGGYIVANPPTSEAVLRERFFNLIHETGHAFNLAHSFQKELVAPGLGDPWSAPAWMPVTTDDRALSWMNYPDSASPGLNASWFYNRFRFRFDDNEHLFLRHAPERFVQMGNAAWFENHGRVSRASLDSRLELQIRTLTPGIRLGQPLNVEFRLRNRSEQPLTIHDELGLSEGFLSLSITDPHGRRRPFLPISRSRCHPRPVVLGPGERVYYSTILTMGRFGWPFKTPGPYRVEAAFQNLDGSTAAAVLRVYVHPPGSEEELSVAGELFDARIGRAICFGGTLVMEDVNDKLDWAIKTLPTHHPSQTVLRSARYLAYGDDRKLLKAGSSTITVQEADHDCVVKEFKPVVDSGVEAINALGHIRYARVIDCFTESSLAVDNVTAATHAQEQMLEVFRARGVISPVVNKLEKRVQKLKGTAQPRRGRKKKSPTGRRGKKKASKARGKKKR